MSNEFIREARYVVLKSADVMKCLTVSELIELRRIQAKVEEHRAEIGKPPLDCVVVESDWPEYEPTWKAIEARVTGAQPAPSVPDGWLRAIDEALVVAHIGVANESDTYEQAKAKLDTLIGLHVDIATDPAVNGGWKLVPSIPEGFSREDLEAVADGLDGYEKTVNVGNVTGEGDDHLESTTAYAARFIRTMLAAAPEAKP